MNSLFISSNLIFENKSSGGRRVSYNNREYLKNVTDGKCYTLYILFDKKPSIALPENEFFYVGCTNKFSSTLNYLRGYAMATPKIKRRVAKFIKENNIDVVFFDSSIFGKILKYVKRKTKVRTICFMHNVEKKYAYSRVKKESFMYYPYYWAYSLNEKISTKYADKLISINKRDADEVLSLYKRTPDLIVPATFDDVFQFNRAKECESNEKQLLFVGSLFQPNIEGLKWFCKNVMPNVKVSLVVVGKGLEILKEELEDENIKIIGTVDDLSDYYYRAKAVVMPIFTGSGMKVKTAEAMMYGKPLFATDEGLEGYIDTSSEIFRCNTSQEFIEAINGFFISNVNGFSDSVRNIFVENYCADNYKFCFKSLLN